MPRSRDFIDTTTACLELLSNPGQALQGDAGTFTIGYDEAAHHYTLDGCDVPSVTQVLDATIPKGGLTWWGFRVGLAAAPRLLADKKLSMGQLMGYAWEPIIRPVDYPDDEHVSINGSRASHMLERLSLAAGHSPNHIKSAKGTLGTSIHAAAQAADEGNMPDIEDFPETDRGYVQAHARYMIASEAEAVTSELIVASKKLMYAGRFDVLVRLPNGTLRLRDYKTSASVYPEADVQLSAYWLAYHQMQLQDLYGPLDGADVVHLKPDGNFEVVPVVIDWPRFVTQLLAFHAQRRHHDHIKQLGRKT